MGKRGKETNRGPWNETTSLIVDRRLSVRQTKSIWPEWQCVMGHFLLACECFCILVATSAKIWARSAGTCETTKTFCSSCISRRCCCCCWWRWLWLWSWLLLVAVVLVAFYPILVVRVPLRNCVALGINGKQPPTSTLGWKMGASFCRQTWKLRSSENDTDFQQTRWTTRR